MITEACLWAVIAASGVAPKSAPIHIAEVRQCVMTVGTYVQNHCPISTSVRTEAERQMWAKIEAVGNSGAKTDTQALVAACR